MEMRRHKRFTSSLNSSYRLMSSRKRKTEQVVKKTEVASHDVKKVKHEAAVEVNVQLKCFSPKYQDDEVDEDEEDEVDEDAAEDDSTFVDARTEISGILFDTLGSPSYNYDCTREGHARVMVDGVKVGEFKYTLIDRTMLGGELDFHEACDAESAEMEAIAAYFFKPGTSGLLNRKFLNMMVDNSSHAMVNHGCFMYISSFLMDAPYDRNCSEEYSMVATAAIEQLIHSPTLQNEGIEVSLIMYIPEGWADPHSRDVYVDELMRKDRRSFENAGFRSIKAGNSDYLFFEVP